MSQQQRNLDPIVHSWPICETFSRSLCSKFIEGTSFSLLFSYENDRVVFRWNDGKVKGTSKTPEINFVVTLRIDGGESGEILLDESWEISNLRCKSAVDLIYSAKVTEPWLNWTNVRIEIHDVTPIGHSGKEAVSRGIVYREIQRPASISAATNDMAKVESGKQSDPIKSVVEAKRIRSTSARVDLKTSPSSSGSDSIPIETSQPKAHNGKQSDPFKPVAKPQQTQSTEGRIALKSPLSTVGSEPIGPPPMKRQKTDESSAAAVNNGDSSTVAAVNVPSLPAKLFPDGYRREAANDVRLIQALTAKIAQLTEDNGRLTSTLSRMQMKLANAEDEAKSNMAEKTAELNQSQLNCERLESECKTQMRKELELVKSHQSELEQGKVKLDKLTSDLCNLQQLNDRNLEEIEDKTKMEENLSAQLVELKKFCEREIKVVNFDTLIFSIRLANQLRSDLLMAECFTFVKQERAKEQMWEDLHSHLQLPKILAQISVFSGSGENAELPKFHFSAGVNPTSSPQIHVLYNLYN